MTPRLLTADEARDYCGPSHPIWKQGLSHGRFTAKPNDFSHDAQLGRLRLYH